MSESRTPSRTALGTAYLRAAHQLLDGQPRILDDPLAIPILGPGAQARITAQPDRYMTAPNLALRSHVVLRSRYAEDRLAASLGRGVTQYVILGAGFDTSPYRLPDTGTLSRIVEVDQPASQREKRERLAAAGLVIPSNCTLGTIDFGDTPLIAGLQELGVGLAQPTFFSWLGVTMYMTREAVVDTLRAIATFPPGSEVVLTFAPPGDGPSHFEERSADVGERWLSHFSVEDMTRLLLDAGLPTLEFLSPEMATARYFVGGSGALPPPHRTTIVSAVR